MSRFGELLRYYRERCADPASNRGRLTQARLGELLGKKLGLDGGYSGAAVSEWERGKSKIDADDRRALVSLIQVLHECKGIQTVTEADTFLLAGNYRPLDESEHGQVFPNESAAQPEREKAPDDRFRMIVFFLGELIFRPSDEFRTLLAGVGQGPPPSWPRALLTVMGWPFKRLSGRQALPGAFWVAAWLVTWTVVFPLMHWPFSDREQAELATLGYAGGSIVVCLLIGGLTRTQEDSFWREQKLNEVPVTRLLTYQSAAIGFHVGYMMIFGLALLGHYARLGRVPFLLEGLAALWPLLLGYAAARQVPFDLWRAFGALRFTGSDALFLIAFTLFGPMWGFFFFEFYEWLLLPLTGIPLILLAIALAAWGEYRNK